MLTPKKKTPVSGRTAFVRNQGATGLSAGMVRERLRQPLTPQELELERAYAAQQRRYQQLTRSRRSYAQSQIVARQDGAIAYHAQAHIRAQLRYQAMTTHQRRLSQELYARLQAPPQPTAVIRQGVNRSAGQAAAHNRQVAFQQRYHQYAEHVRATNSPQIANTILHDVVLQNVAQGGLQVVGPGVTSSVAVARLAATARWLGAVRVARLAGGLAQGLSYRTPGAAGILTWQGAKQAVDIFGRRAAVDVGLQYVGALGVTALKPKNRDKSAFDIAVSSINEISLSSMVMAGLPGETLGHSLRNAAVSNAFEWKMNLESRTYMSFGLANHDTSLDILNYTQKVGFSVGADYLVGRFTGLISRAYAGTRLVRPIGSRFDPHVLAEWRQTRLLLKAMEYGQYPIKVAGGVAGGITELSLKPEPIDSSAAPFNP